MCDEYQRNYYLAGSLLYHIGTKSKRNLLNFYLARNSTSLSDFINKYQHDLYHLFCREQCCQCTSGSSILTKNSKVLHFKEMELLFNKNSKMHCHNPASKNEFCCSPSNIILHVDDLDITLLQCLLTNICLDLFWCSCLLNGNKNLETFLDDNKHLLFHLWKRNDKCCKSTGLSGKINNRQWATIFETTHTGRKNIDTWQFSVKKGIIDKNLDTGLTRVIFGNICPLFISIQKIVLLRNILAHNTEGKIPNLEFKTVWNDCTDCILIISKFLGKETEVKADIEVLKEKIPTTDVYYRLLTNMQDTHTIIEEQSELRKAENEHTHKELNVLKEKMVNIEKQSELREAENEHTHKELKVLKEIMVNIISEVVFKGKVKSRSEFEAEDNANNLEGAHSDDTAKSKDVFICGTCNQFYMETSDNMSIVIAEHKTKCPRRQAEKNFTTKITIDGLSRSYEDRTIKSSKVTDALEYQEISIDSVEKGGIVIWVRIPTTLCLSKKSVTSAVQGFLKSFFSNYPIETNDVANITVKLRVQLGEGNGLDDECDYIYCGKCQSEFKEVTQYYRHNNLECEVRRQNEAQNINKKDGSISVRNEQIIYQRLERKSGTVFETNSNVETSDISSSDKAPQPFVVNHLPGRISDIVHEMKKLCVQCSNIPTNTHDITSKTERNEEKNVKRRTVQELPRVSLGGIEPTLDSIVPTLMVRNSNGGDSYGVDDFILLHRYFCLGYDGGSSFESEPVLKRKMFLCIDRLLISGKGNDILRMIIDLSVNNGTWQHTPMNIALAVCAKNIIDPTTRARAYSLVPEVCRIPTHLFEFIEYCEAEGSGTGWGRSLRRAISNWYNSFENNPMRLVYLISRYKARHGWKHRDVVRLAHIKPANRQIELIIRYITHGLLYATSLAKNDTSLITYKIKDFLLAIETARKGINVHTNELKQLIIRHRLVKQHIHYSFLGDKQIWECLLLVMPTTALISNLDKMSSLNLFESQSVWEKNVIDRLQNISKEEQIHPITLLIAWYRYENNHNGYKGQFSWSINNKILNALEYAFYKAFDIIQPTQKRLCLAVDVSCSMKSLMFGSMLTAQDIAAAMVSLLTKIETDYEVVAFSDQCTRLHFTKDFGLSTSIKIFDHFPTGKSDCTMPIKWALDKSLIFDTFILFTDSETYNYNDQTGEVLNNYRISTKNKDVRLINVGMASNGFSISNPHDPSMIDITGLFRSAVKNIADFLQSDLPSYQYNYSSAKKNIEYCYSQLGIN